jgi:hypothetical protein
LHQRVAHAARIVDRVGEPVGMTVRAVADDEGDALLGRAGRDEGTDERQQCNDNDVKKPHLRLRNAMA